MAKRKRAVTVKAESMAALSTAKLERPDALEEEEREEEENFEPELAPTEEEDSEGFDPELDGNGNKKGKGKRNIVKNSSTRKTTPKGKKPAVSRKDMIKTEDKNGEPIIRAPQVNSDYLPLPWKGRLGYACLNTYLRTSNPPVFCSRTCRISTILQKGSTADGQAYVESLGLANAWDLGKLIRWNEKYGIKFLRISSEMFPFASHEKYGYSLDFAAEPLREAGRLAMEFGHRLTTHPGQYTQLASPRKEVIAASVRDLEYHSQLLQLLGLGGQADRDAVMILHMGGVFGDKKATLDRFRESYMTLLSDDIKARLVLENDDVNWNVHDLLPICQELNIPLVLDYHHHNIRHRADLREGTLDLIPLLPEIKQTWTRKNITQKQHYSEARDDAVTDHDMRKHSKRVRNLPPCDPDMDLMIEAKDKEQAVFELYQKYGIGGDELFREVIPHVRTDENVLGALVKGKKGKKNEGDALVKTVVSEKDVGMGGEERRVYWPQGKEDWLSPTKKVRKQKEEVTMGREESGDIVGENTTKKRLKAKEMKEAVKEEVAVKIKNTRRRKAKHLTVKADGTEPLLGTTEPRVPRAEKRRRTATRIKCEDDEAVHIPNTNPPVIEVPKRTRKAVARRPRKAVASHAGSDSDLSSLSDDEEFCGVREDYTDVDVAARVAREQYLAFSPKPPGSAPTGSRVATVPQQSVLPQADAELEKRRSNRARKTVRPYVPA